MSSTNTWRTVRLATLAILLVPVAEAPAFQLGAQPVQEMIERTEWIEKTAGFKAEVELVIAYLELKPGDIVADIGAGAGAFSRPLARAVAPTGKLLAVDIDKNLLQYVDQRAKQEQSDNIQTVLGKFDDPNLPTRQVDLAFFHDVLHHIEHREAYLKALSSYLKPNGRIALIELNQKDPQTPHRGQTELLISKDEVEHWMAAAGFRPVREISMYGMKDKWFIIYVRR